MRRYLTVQSTLAIFAALVLVLMWANPARPGEPPKAKGDPVSDADKKLPQDDDFVVHEWGTFTSFSGSDGVSLDFRTTTTEDLPAFVLDRQKQAFLGESRDKAYARGLTIKATTLSRQRMETPVTYFYTPRERIVDVTVEFPRGLLTEFYPPVRQFGPDYKKDQAAPLENVWRLHRLQGRIIPNSLFPIVFAGQVGHRRLRAGPATEPERPAQRRRG
jgi:hypothetical protein